MMQSLFAQFSTEAWGVFGTMFVTILAAVGHLSLRFGKLEERVKSGLAEAHRQKQELESWVRDIASGQTVTCAKHAEKLETLEHGELRLGAEVIRVKEEVADVKERVAVLEAAH